MQDGSVSQEHVLIQCAAALGQCIGNLDFSDEAGSYAGQFFAERLSDLDDWSEHRTMALEFSRRLGVEIARVTRDRNSHTIEARDIERAIEDLVGILRCPLSP